MLTQHSQPLLVPGVDNVLPSHDLNVGLVGEVSGDCTLDDFNRGITRCHCKTVSACGGQFTPNTLLPFVDIVADKDDHSGMTLCYKRKHLFDILLHVHRILAHADCDQALVDFWNCFKTDQRDVRDFARVCSRDVVAGFDRCTHFGFDE